MVVAPADEADAEAAREDFLGEPLEGAVVGVDFRQVDELGVEEIEVARAAAHVGDAHHVLSAPEGLPEGGDGEPVVINVCEIVHARVGTPVDHSRIARVVDVVIAPACARARPLIAQEA